MPNSSETKESLKGGRGGLAAVVPEDEFVEIDLELGLTYTVICADQPLLEISNSAIGERNSRLRALSERRSQWLRSGDMSEPSLRQAAKGLEAIGVDGRTGRDILVEERGFKTPILSLINWDASESWEYLWFWMISSQVIRA